ncbi:MAG TPA: urate hydroxylase PuuD [Gaiellaceae bacterium]|nr:urate hydroxylase PuuD [Gaiellaceae bacterium]
MAALLGLGDYWWGWGNLLFRWLHVLAAIAWIGSSFYFIALDDHLSPPADERDRARGVAGEAWEIHGGGFYRVEKFRVAPRALPEPLYWFKWEAYTTWLSGFALLVVVFFVHPRASLVDPAVADLAGWEAVAVAAGGLAVAWIVYDGLCRLLARDERLLALAVLGFAVLASYGAGRLLSARAAYVEVGAMLGTMMAGNVLFVIIPAHRELVRAKQAGREPDPRWNVRGKQRSVHNNYLTLPVLFAMLSNHFPFTYGHDDAWVVLVCLMAVGAWTRHFFNLRHRGRNEWWILATAAAGVAGLAIWLRPHTSAAAAAGPAPTRAQVQAVVGRRCVPCHSLHPTQPGVASPPSGVVLDTWAKIDLLAPLVKTVAVDNRLMPPSNATHMTQDERDLLARWLAHR